MNAITVNEIPGADAQDTQDAKRRQAAQVAATVDLRKEILRLYAAAWESYRNDMEKLGAILQSIWQWIKRVVARVAAAFGYRSTATDSLSEGQMQGKEAVAVDLKPKSGTDEAEKAAAAQEAQQVEAADAPAPAPAKEASGGSGAQEEGVVEALAEASLPQVGPGAAALTVRDEVARLVDHICANPSALDLLGEDAHDTCLRHVRALASYRDGFATQLSAAEMDMREMLEKVASAFYAGQADGVARAEHDLRSPDQAARTRLFDPAGVLRLRMAESDALRVSVARVDTALSALYETVRASAKPELARAVEVELAKTAPHILAAASPRQADLFARPDDAERSLPEAQAPGLADEAGASRVIAVDFANKYSAQSSPSAKTYIESEPDDDIALAGHGVADAAPQIMAVATDMERGDTFQRTNPFAELAASSAKRNNQSAARQDLAQDPVRIVDRERGH